MMTPAETPMGKSEPMRGQDTRSDAMKVGGWPKERRESSMLDHRTIPVDGYVVNNYGAPKSSNVGS